MDFPWTVGAHHELDISTTIPGKHELEGDLIHSFVSPDNQETGLREQVNSGLLEPWLQRDGDERWILYWVGIFLRVVIELVREEAASV